MIISEANKNIADDQSRLFMVFFNNMGYVSIHGEPLLRPHSGFDTFLSSFYSYDEFVRFLSTDFINLKTQYSLDFNFYEMCDNKLIKYKLATNGKTFFLQVQTEKN